MAVTARAVTCPQCGAPLRGHGFNTGGELPCERCDAPVAAHIFPALFRSLAPGSAGEQLLAAEDASCFYHPAKKAVAPCDACGRFICSLCEVELDGRHLCPNCLATGRKKAQLPQLENERVLYDNIALSMALLPLLMFPFTILTAPATLFICFRHGKRPPSIVGRSRVRFVIAGLLALTQIGGWGVLAFFLLTRT